MLTLTRHAEPGEHWDAELAMTHELRCKTRLRTRSADGEDVALFLAAGSPPLADGDRLLANDGRVARVRALPEPLLHVTAADARELTRAAYHLGNRHVPIELQPDHLKIEPDHVLADMLRAMHLIVTEQNMAFEPEGGAYAAGHGGGHSHGGHGHGDDHHHGHGQGHSHDHDHDHTHDHGHTHEHSHAAAPATAPARGRTVSIPVVAQGHVHGPGCNHAH